MLKVDLFDEPHVFDDLPTVGRSSLSSYQATLSISSIDASGTRRGVRSSVSTMRRSTSTRRARSHQARSGTASASVTPSLSPGLGAAKVRMCDASPGMRTPLCASATGVGRLATRHTRDLALRYVQSAVDVLVPTPATAGTLCA